MQVSRINAYASGINNRKNAINNQPLNNQPHFGHFAQKWLREKFITTVTDGLQNNTEAVDKFMKQIKVVDESPLYIMNNNGLHLALTPPPNPENARRTLQTGFDIDREKNSYYHYLDALDVIISDVKLYDELSKQVGKEFLEKYNVTINSVLQKEYWGKTTFAQMKDIVKQKLMEEPKLLEKYDSSEIEKKCKKLNDFWTGHVICMGIVD